MNIQVTKCEKCGRKLDVVEVKEKSGSSVSVRYESVCPKCRHWIIADRKEDM